MEYQDIWSQALKYIQPSISPLSFNAFFKNSYIEKIREGAEEFTVGVTVPHKLARDKFEQHKKDVEQALMDVLAAPCRLELITKDKDKPPADNLGDAVEDVSIKRSMNDASDGIGRKLTATASETRTVDNTRNLQEDDSTPLFAQSTQDYIQSRQLSHAFNLALKKSNINPEHTFENFAVSPTNEVAFAGATAVAKNPGITYNPFFIYGDVGVGKTHLMHATGIRILENNPATNIVYCIGEQFTNEIIEAIQTKKTPQFRNRYRKVNVLLIDDIQFIAGKDFVQEEFFHTFNAIKTAGGQVIMTADKPPHEIKFLEDRLRSRFEEGLAIDVQEPNFELRTAILLIKAKQIGMNLPMECAQQIAQHTTSTRKLEGFLKNIFAKVSVNNTPITTGLISEFLKQQGKEDVPEEKRAFIRPREMIKYICKHYNVSEQLLYGPKRARPIVTPRQYAMYLLRIDLKLSFQEIGRIFGGRDHTTVMHAVEKVSNEVNKSDIMQQEFSTLRKHIYG